MKKIWKHTRDSKLRWILIILGFSLGVQYNPAFWTLAGLGAMIILGDTAERFYKGILGEPGRKSNERAHECSQGDLSLEE